MYLMRPPSRAKTHDQQHQSGHQSADIQALQPVNRNGAEHDADERPGRPADLHPRSSERRNNEPRTTAVKIPACGVTPDAIPKPIASGSATIPTVNPAIRSAIRSCANSSSACPPASGGKSSQSSFQKTSKFFSNDCILRNRGQNTIGF